MANNDKPNPARGTEPNKNYARAVLQLFSIGLWQLNPDGSTRVGANGTPLRSHDPTVVEGFAHAFSGWTYPTLPSAVSRFGNTVSFAGAMVAFAPTTTTRPSTCWAGQCWRPASKPLGRARAALLLAVMSPEDLVEH